MVMLLPVSHNIRNKSKFEKTNEQTIPINVFYWNGLHAELS